MAIGDLFAIQDLSGSEFFRVTSAGNIVLSGTVSLEGMSLGDSETLKFGDANDITMGWDGTDFDVLQATANSSIKWGIDGAGIDHVFYGDTAGSNMTWDQSADSLIFTDSTPIVFGDGSDMTLQFNATNLVLATAVADTGAFVLGADGAGVDFILYGDTASENVTWDQSADAFVMTANTAINGQGSTVVGTTPSAAQQTLAAGGGAVTITEYYTAGATDAGGDAWTLVDGAQIGQFKKIQLITDGGGDAVLTPTTLSGGTTITFADVGDYAILKWTASGWVAIELGNAADGATAPVLA